MDTQASRSREKKKASAELLVLATIEQRPLHGYEIAKRIEQRSEGVLCFHVASLYTLLYRLEGRQLMVGRWLEKAGQRRRRHYRLTPQGRKVLAEHRQQWREFVRAIDQVAQLGHA